DLGRKPTPLAKPDSRLANATRAAVPDKTAAGKVPAAKSNATAVKGRASNAAEGSGGIAPFWIVLGLLLAVAATAGATVWNMRRPRAPRSLMGNLGSP